MLLRESWLWRFCRWKGFQNWIKFLLFRFTSSKNKNQWLCKVSISKIKFPSTGVNTFCTLWRVSQLFYAWTFLLPLVEFQCQTRVIAYKSYIFSSPVASVSWELEYKVLFVLSPRQSSKQNTKKWAMSFFYLLFSNSVLRFLPSVCCSGVMI
jgi:hypothetical protein